MNNFLKENWFKLIIAIMIVVVGLSVAYYYVSFLPQKERTRLEQQKQEQLAKEIKEQTAQKEKCREIGTRAYESYKSIHQGVDYFFEPEFKFNKELNTCIYSGGYSRGNYWDRFVKDAFTDRIIILTYNFIDEKDERQEEMDAKRIELFWEKYEKLFVE